MESPGPFEARSLASWRTHSNLHSVTSTPSSLGPELAPTSVPCCYTPDIEALSPLMQSPPDSAVRTPISPLVSLSNRHIYLVMDFTASTASPPINPCLNSPFDLTNHMPRSVSISSLRRSPPCPNGGMSTQDDHEIAFLLRCFSEGPGYWMDSFDPGTYFASHVPVKARENPLLKYAAIACAAKALARVQGRKPAMGGSVMCQAGMKRYPDTPLVDWKHKTAVYYDTAVSLLLHALNMKLASSSDESKCELRQRNRDPASAYDGSAPKRRRTSSNTSFVSSAEELLAATAILCFYEFLDTSVSEWEKHLNGAKSLLVLSQEKVMPLQLVARKSPMPSASFKFASKARRVAFWNIARQDMHAACKYSQPSKLKCY
jgi:hypothetical protein